MIAARIILGILIVGALTYTVLAYPGKYGALSGRSRLFRSVGVFLVDLLLVLVFMYTFIDFYADVSRRVGAIRWLLYVSSCLFLCFALICTAALDALESYSAMRRERRAYLENLVREAAEEQEKRKQKKSASSGEKRD